MELLEKDVDTLVEHIASFEMKWGSTLALQFLEALALEIQLDLEGAENGISN